MTNWEDLPLLPQHVELLKSSAIAPEVALAAGVRSVETPEELPDGLAYTPVPALVFTWKSPTGHVEYQTRPDRPTPDANGRLRKYLWREGMVPVLGKMRECVGARKIWIVEGTKQSLSAASYAPDDVEVYGIGGCRMWMHEGAPISDLAVAEGKEVCIFLDADAATNRDVYDAGEGLADALRAEGAAEVKFVRLPAGKAAGLDDILAKREPGRRAAYLARLVAAAGNKPAETKPKPKSKAEEKREQVLASDRPVVIVNWDRYGVINALIHYLRERWDGRELFNHGGTFARLHGHELKVINRGSFKYLIAETVRTVSEGQQGGYVDTWPDSFTIDAVLSRANEFTPLDRVSRAPFVRPDGTICQTPGYDEMTRTVLVPDPELSSIDVPDDPTPEEIEGALRFLRDEWLGDMPLPEDADRSNLLALVLTPLIRGLVPRVPLAVIDGLQMGVGKNLLADCVSILVTGETTDPKPYTIDEDEQRKSITAAFRTGDELFVFDEAHVLGGNALARALTAEHYSDRILGYSEMAKFPNRVTWISLGNNVRLQGDITRRVYRIRLAPNVPNPQDRGPECFRHPDLREWTREHRAELLRAALTLIRAWFVAGRPASLRGASFGSFETWGRMVGGILAVAQQPGFLDNLQVWRSESDFDSQWWAEHLAWLADQFCAQVFSTSEVRSKALGSEGFRPPPYLDDPTDRGYSRKLGQAYARIAGRVFDGLRIIKVGQVNHTGQWRVVAAGGEGPTPDPDPRITESKRSVTQSQGKRETKGISEPSMSRGDVSPARTHALLRNKGSEGSLVSLFPDDLGRATGPVVFDLETADQAQLFSYGPGFVRLGGFADGSIKVTADIDGLARMLETAPQVVGHNILGFDLIALARYHGVDIWSLVDRGAVFDTLLAARYVDPPMARDKGVDAERKYNLDTLGEKFGLGQKSDALKRLAKQFGGYDKIPLDHPDYLEYLRRDVHLSVGLYAVLRRDDSYLAREHRVAALAAQISLNGFRVDVDLLARRLAEGEQRKAEALAELRDRFGIPLANDKGKPFKSPLASAPGKQALLEAFHRLGATTLPTTEKSGQLMISGDAMVAVKTVYSHLPDVVRLCDLVATVTGERTIYQTIEAHRVGDRVHPRISMDQATGRWSLTKPGLTVMGKRGGRYREREVFLPEPGHVIIAVDFAQIDARAVAALSGDPEYAKLFQPGVDAHAEVARLVWGDPSRRDDAKPLGHGWNYGMGLKKLAETAGVPFEVAEQFDTAMKVQFPTLVEWRKHVRSIAESGQLLDNGFGRKMRPDPERAHTQGPALEGQGAARDIAMEGLLRLPREVHPYLRAFVHDEIVLSVPEDIADDVERTVVECLSWEWRGVPIIAEPQTRKTPDGRKVPVRGRNWGEVYAK